MVSLRSGEEAREVWADYVAPQTYDVRLARPGAVETAPPVRVRFTRGAGHTLRMDAGGRSVHATVVPNGARRHVFQGGTRTDLELFDPLDVEASSDVAEGGLRAPMPGKVVAHLVAVGTKVTKGTPLMVLEAMKMELTVTAPRDGVVASFRYAPGAQVSEGAELLVFEDAP